MRAFLAVALPEEPRRGLGRFVQRLREDPDAPIAFRSAAARGDKSRAPARLRWVRTENLHATVVFLGEVEPPMIDALCHVMRSTCAAIPSFRAVLGDAGVFPATSQGRVLWVEMDGGPAVPRMWSEVQKALALVDEALVERSLIVEPRADSPAAHVTVARCEPPLHALEVAAYRAAWAKTALASSERSMPVEELTLFRSDRHPGGARYAVLERFPLGRSEEE